MSNFHSYVARHHVGLVALLLVVTGGTAYAATAIPKSSVASKQVKDNSLRGKDVKDGNLTGADLADGSVGGSDLADGGVGPSDLAPGSVDGGKVKDGSVGTVDLAPGTVPQVLTLTKIAAADSNYHGYATFPRLGEVQFWCDATAVSLKYIAPGDGVTTYSYVEVAALDGDVVDADSATASSAFIIQRTAIADVAAGRIVAHTSTQSIDVDVRMSHEDGCTIAGTATVTPNTSGLPS